MARTFNLVGSSTINLINTAATGIIAEQRGFGEPDIPVGVREGVVVVERWTFNLKASSHDNAATQIQDLIKVSREAKEFFEEIWRTSPVYLQVQTSNETNTRYSIVREIINLVIPDVFAIPFDPGDELEGFSMTVVREHPWRSEVPNTLPTAITLNASDGPAGKSKVHISNFRDDEDVNSIYVDDGGVFSANRASTAAFDLFPTTAVAGDALYIGATAPWKHIVFEIGTAANVSADLLLEYSDGGAGWPDGTLGTQYTAFAENGGEVTSDDNLFNQTGMWSINIFPPSDWASETVNGDNRYWIRIRVVSVTSWTTTPANATNEPYSQRSPYLEVDSLDVKGDGPGTYLLRSWTPSGGDENEGPSSLSRILIFAKSRNLTNFTPFLNAGEDDNPAAWTVTQGTDATKTADPQAPGGQRSNVDFSTDTTLVSRVQFSGDDLLDDYVGEYRIYVRCQQIGGTAGDLRLMVRSFIGGTAVSDPHLDTRQEKTRGADQGPEVLDMGLLQIPFSRAYNSDSLATTDLIFQVHAQRSTGSSTLRIYDLILMPVDEGAVGVDDPVTDSTNGSSALRGGNVLDIDNGVLANRILKYTVQGANLIPSEAWRMMNRPIDFTNLAADTRLYFLMLHYPSGGSWGTEPLIANLGCHLVAELYPHYSYSILRGSD